MREEERYIDFPRLFILAQRNTRGATERNKRELRHEAPMRFRRLTALWLSNITASQEHSSASPIDADRDPWRGPS